MTSMPNIVRLLVKIETSIEVTNLFRSGKAAAKVGKSEASGRLPRCSKKVESQERISPS